MTQTGSAADALAPANPTTTDTVDAPLTRRARREAETAMATRKGRAIARTASSAPTTPTAPSSPAGRRPVVAAARTAAPASAAGGAALRRTTDRSARTASAPSRKRRFMAPLVLTLTAGMFGTMAVPAAFATTQQDPTGSTGQAQIRTADAQQFAVSDAVAIADTGRDGYGATSQASLDASAAASAAAAHAAQVQAQRAATAQQYASYSGPTAQQYAQTAVAANTPFSLPAVVATAKQYIGTPYVFGGATPAGFDCSGYVMFVYAQYGIQLAHSVPLQDQAGTTIPESQAQPGDVVIFNSEAHDGFYMGNGMIMDAPKPGGRVSIRPIWTSDYHIVRFGV